MPNISRKQRCEHRLPYPARPWVSYPVTQSPESFYWLHAELVLPDLSPEPEPAGRPHAFFPFFYYP